MKKQTCLVLLPILLFITTSAIARQNHRFSFGGFYAGAGFGGSFMSGSLRFSRSASFSAPALPTPLVISHVGQVGLKNNSFMGEIYVGYGYNCYEPYYLSVEAYLKGTKANATFSNVVSASGLGAPRTVANASIGESAHARLNGAEVGLDLRAGVFLTCKTLLYGRVGIAFNELTISSEQTVSLQDPPAFSVNFPVSASEEKTAIGLRLGMGLEQEICSNFTLRADYVATLYDSGELKGSGGATSTQGGVGVASVYSKVRVFTQTIMLGVTYYW